MRILGHMVKVGAGVALGWGAKSFLDQRVSRVGRTHVPVQTQPQPLGAHKRKIQEMDRLVGVFPMW